MTLLFVSVLFAWALVRLNIYFHEESIRFWIWITGHTILCLKMKCPSPKNSGSPKQDKPKAKHPKAHINQINKDQTQTTNIKKQQGKKQQIIHKGIPIRITADLSIETLQARREWQDILKVMKENNLQPRLLYPERISFKYEGEIKSFTDKQKLREFSTTKPALQQILKDIL